MASDSGVKTLSVPAGEWWWGGAVADGQLMPFGKAPHRRNLATSAGFVDDDRGSANQSAPFLVSAPADMSGPRGRSRLHSTAPVDWNSPAKT